MFQELALQTSAQSWVIATMLLFIAVFTWVVVGVFRTPAAVHQQRARLPLDDSVADDSTGDPQRNLESQG